MTKTQTELGGHALLLQYDDDVLVKEDIMLGTHSKSFPNLFHVGADIHTVDGCVSVGRRKEPRQN